MVAFVFEFKMFVLRLSLHSLPLSSMNLVPLQKNSLLLFLCCAVHNSKPSSEPMGFSLPVHMTLKHTVHQIFIELCLCLDITLSKPICTKIF